MAEPGSDSAEPRPGRADGAASSRVRLGRWWIGLVFVFALVPRIWGIDWQLPDALYYDELKYVSWASAKVDDRALSRTDFRNPSLFRHLLAAEYQVANALDDSDDDARWAVRRLAMARVTSAVLGAGGVTLTALAAARLYSPWLGIVAGLVVGLSLLHINVSHMALNDAPASFFFAAGLLFGVGALVAPHGRNYLLAGIAAGLAAAAKYNSGVILCLPLASLVVHVASGRLRRASAASYLALSVIGGVIGLLVGMPEILWSAREILGGMAEQARVGAKPQVGQWDAPVPLLFVQTLAHGSGGPVAVALAVVGLAWMLHARRGQALALLASPLAYLVVMSRNELFAARFTLPLVPFVAVFAAAGLAWIASWRVSTQQRQLAFGLLLPSLVVPAGLDAVQLNHLATTTDTRVLAQEWVRGNARDVRVAAQTFALPAAWGGRERLRGYRVKRFESLADSASMTELACEGVRYVLVASFAQDRYPTRPALIRGSTGYELLERHGRLVETFSPFRPGRFAPGNSDDTAIPFWDIHAYARPGMVIEIYDIADGGAALCAAR